MRFRKVVVAVLLLLLCASYAAYALTQPLAALQPTVSFKYSRPAQTVSLDWPSYGEAAIGAVGFGVLATHGDEKPLPTASTIKVLTALAVLRQYPLKQSETGPTITLTQTDVDTYNKYVDEDGSVVRVAVGEQLSEYQALQALLLPSANNIAETLARWAFGSIDAYNSYATDYARQLGMTGTTVTDPSGFLPTTISTPRDLVILGEAALSNPVVAEIVNQASATIPVHGTIKNVNVLLGHAGIVGIKTGNNDQNLGCFLFASIQTVGNTSVTIIGVVMDGPSLGRAMWDSLPLIRSAADDFSEVDIIHAGDAVGSYHAPWQQQVTAVAQKTLSIVAWNGESITANSNLEAIGAPAKTATNVGTITVVANQSYTAAVTLQKPINQPNIFWRLVHAQWDEP